MLRSEQRLARQTSHAASIRVACLASLVSLFLITGCAPLARRQSPSPPLAANAGQRTLTDSGLKQFIEQQSRQPLTQWPLQTWDFPKLTLAASYFSPSLATARSQWQQAEMELAAARGQSQSAKAQAHSFAANALLPPSAIIERDMDVARPHGTRFSPAQTNIESPVRLSSKDARRIAEAERAAQSARWHLEAMAWQVRTGVRSKLIIYVALQRGISLLEELEETSEKLVKSAELRVATDSMSYLELSQLRLQLAQIRLVLIRARLERMDARVHLAESLSLPVNVLFDVEVEFDFSQRAPLLLTTRDLRRQALHSRPDVLNVLADHTEAEDALRHELSKRHPHSQFTPGCSWNERKNRWEINTELRLPARQRISRNAARAEAHRLAAAARQLNLQADIIDEVERSATVYRVTTEEVGEVHALVAALVRQYAALENRLESGVADAPELLLARLQVMAAGVAKLEAQVKLQNALGSLENALQLPIERIGRASSF
jgi:outer membrane protein, heavy metal efflux system